MFNVGQAQLARYPVHFHFDKDFEYRATNYGQTERQSVSHLSIHDANSRFVTVHATNDVIGKLDKQAKSGLISQKRGKNCSV